jgi:hypothetical protein
MAMKAGARTSFDWTANGAVVNFDAHGDGNGRSVSYKKGKGAPSDTGELVAAFDGYHGWYWRNRTEKDVTMTLRTQGDYAEIKRGCDSSVLTKQHWKRVLRPGDQRYA